MSALEYVSLVPPPVEEIVIAPEALWVMLTLSPAIIFELTFKVSCFLASSVVRVVVSTFFANAVSVADLVYASVIP